MRSKNSVLILGLILMLGLSFQSFAKGDKIGKTYNGYVLDLGNNMMPKMMNKAWKKRKAAWGTEVEGASSVAALGKLLVEFENNLSEKAILEAWPERKSAWATAVNSAKTYPELGDLLVELEEGIKNDSKLETWDETREEWLGKITDTGKAVMMEAEKVELDVEGLSSTFATIWGASDNSFTDVKVGDGEVVANIGTIYESNVKMPQAKSSRIVQVIEDDSDNFSFMAVYEGGQFEVNARELYNAIAKEIDSLVPENFPRLTNHRSDGVKMEFYAWEFASENFNDVAKRSTVSLSLLNSNGMFAIELRVSEKVFK